MSEAKRSGCKSCLMWMLIAFGLLAIAIGTSVYFGYRKLVALRDQYTQPQPQALPVEVYNPGEVDAVKQRLDSFLANARGVHTNARLALSARDLNALLASAGITNRVCVAFTNQSLAGRISVPLEDLGIRFLQGRFLNGAVFFDVGRENGELSVKVKDISVNGRSLPEHYMGRIRSVNYAQGVATNSSAHGAFQNISRVSVENDRLVMEIGGTNSLR